MIITIDVGNTNITVGVFNGDEIVASFLSFIIDKIVIYLSFIKDECVWKRMCLRL